MAPSTTRRPPFVLLIAAVLVVGLGACRDDGGSSDSTSGAGGTDAVADGQALYEDTCAACHGTDLMGTDTGPPFLDAIYEPGHHPDEAFVAAVENGVQPHHWNFGPMPPQAHVSRAEVEAIVAYVRAEQREAGIIE